MTNEEKDKLLYEPLGWTIIGRYKDTILGTFPGIAGGPVTIPSFFHERYGLWPCYQLERELEDPDMRERYRINLNAICGYGKAWKDSECNDDIVFASAPQRAEALGRTLNLWKGEE